MLLEGNYLADNHAVLCLAGSNHAQTNFKALGSDAYSNYTHRQLDQTTQNRIDGLGNYELGAATRALLLDFNQFVPPRHRRPIHSLTAP